MEATSETPPPQTPEEDQGKKRIDQAQKVFSFAAQKSALDSFGGIDGVDRTAGNAWQAKRKSDWAREMQDFEDNLPDLIAANRQEGVSDTTIRNALIEHTRKQWIRDWSNRVANNKTVFADDHDFQNDKILTTLGFGGNNKNDMQGFLGGDFYQNYCGEGGVKKLVDKLMESVTIGDEAEKDESYDQLNEMRTKIMDSAFLKTIFGGEELRNACIVLCAELRATKKLHISDEEMTQGAQARSLNEQGYGVYHLNEKSIIDILEPHKGEEGRQDRQRTNDRRGRQPGAAAAPNRANAQPAAPANESAGGQPARHPEPGGAAPPAGESRQAAGSEIPSAPNEQLQRVKSIFGAEVVDRVLSEIDKEAVPLVVEWYDLFAQKDFEDDEEVYIQVRAVLDSERRYQRYPKLVEKFKQVKNDLILTIGDIQKVLEVNRRTLQFRSEQPSAEATLSIGEAAAEPPVQPDVTTGNESQAELDLRPETVFGQDVVDQALDGLDLGEQPPVRSWLEMFAKNDPNDNRLMLIEAKGIMQIAHSFPVLSERLRYAMHGEELTIEDVREVVGLPRKVQDSSIKNETQGVLNTDLSLTEAVKILGVDAVNRAIEGYEGKEEMAAGTLLNSLLESEREGNETILPIARAFLSQAAEFPILSERLKRVMKGSYLTMDDVREAFRLPRRDTTSTGIVDSEYGITGTAPQHDGDAIRSAAPQGAPDAPLDRPRFRWELPEIIIDRGDLLDRSKRYLERDPDDEVVHIKYSSEILLDHVCTTEWKGALRGYNFAEDTKVEITSDGKVKIIGGLKKGPKEKSEIAADVILVFKSVDGKLVYVKDESEMKFSEVNSLLGNLLGSKRAFEKSIEQVDQIIRNQANGLLNQNDLHRTVTAINIVDKYVVFDFSKTT